MAFGDSVRCLPAAQCCCGCSVSFGVKAIIAAHFYFVLRSFVQTASLILSSSGSSITTEAQLCQQVFSAMLYLSGLPIIVLAFWGVIQRIESLVRCYFWYGLVCVAIDMWFVVNIFILGDPCKNMPSFLAERETGQAAVCGMFRMLNFIVVCTLIALQIYMIYIVWSHCEDLAEGGGADLADLTRDAWGRPLDAEAIRKLLMKQDPSTSLMGLEGNGAGADCGFGACGNLLDTFTCGLCGALTCGMCGSDCSLCGGGDKHGQQPPNQCETCCPGFARTLGLGSSQQGFGAGSAYNYGSDTGLGNPNGNGTIFNGFYHEMQFPPPRHMMAKSV